MRKAQNILVLFFVFAACHSPSKPPNHSDYDVTLPFVLRDLLATQKWDKTPAGFRIVALSNVADGCAAEAIHDANKKPAALACVDACIKLAKKIAPPQFRSSPAEVGLWSSHFNLLLGARDKLAACHDAEEHRRISAALAARSKSEPTHHIPSYPKTDYRWPADQTVTLASLSRYDVAHQSHLSAEPIRLWKEYVLTHAMDKETQLPWSEVTGDSKAARLPRGCALSWQTRYLAEFDLPLAHEWWERYKKIYFVDRLFLVGFREWPPGHDRVADIDSGPIVNHVGAAATGFALGAARLMGDLWMAKRLSGTARMMDSLTRMDEKLYATTHTLLAEAIRYYGSVAVKAQ